VWGGILVWRSGVAWRVMHMMMACDGYDVLLVHIMWLWQCVAPVDAVDAI